MSGERGGSDLSPLSQNGTERPDEEGSNNSSSTRQESPAPVESLADSDNGSPNSNGPPGGFPQNGAAGPRRAGGSGRGGGGGGVGGLNGPMSASIPAPLRFPGCGTLNGPLYERLSHSDVSELREAFLLLADTEKESQEITPQSLAKMLHHIGQHPKDESELKLLISAADQIRNGTISFPEFVVLMAYKIDDPQAYDMVSAFKHFDRANTGIVSRAQFCELFAGFGDKEGGPDEVEEMLNQADPMGTDRIDYLKWVQGMVAGTGLQTAAQQVPQSAGGGTTPVGSFVMQ